MNWTELLRGNIEYTYGVTQNLVKMVDDKDLNWRPATGANWMTTGQLLRHISDACGAPCKGFVTGDWGFPKDVDPSKLSPEDMLPPAEKMPTVDSVAATKKLLQEDKKTALEILAKCSEQDLWCDRPGFCPQGPAVRHCPGDTARHRWARMTRTFWKIALSAAVNCSVATLSR